MTEEVFQIASRANQRLGVNLKAKQADKANQNRARWFFCALYKHLQRSLQEQMVSCALGKFYNQDTILEYLLDKSTYGDGESVCGQMRSLKDVKTLNLAQNPTSASDSTERAQFVCSLTLKEMNGSQSFIYISACGCAFSQAGLKTISASSSLKEGQDSPEPNLREMNMREAMKRRQLLELIKLKKPKKRKNGEEEPEPASKKTKPLPAPSTHTSIAATSRAVTSSQAMEKAKRKANMSALSSRSTGMGRRDIYGEGYIH
ncbi:hypothetical protein Moror_17856 [Moniliophthora roreri MCA 2997]|uniref:Replication termination factor 2 n=1 Tax=Moniliophthora roreri (strain MCA 2997) TaxID=1381753 RepID=V2XWP7_MONRO|nr:hypothetical protein Moror_17856 [Moniliophthora roreri MCA 2997]